MCIQLQGCFLISQQHDHHLINAPASAPCDTSSTRLSVLQLNIHPRVALGWSTNYLHTSKSELPVHYFNSYSFIQLLFIIEYMLSVYYINFVLPKRVHSGRAPSTKEGGGPAR